MIIYDILQCLEMLGDDASFLGLFIALIRDASSIGKRMTSPVWRAPYTTQWSVVTCAMGQPPKYDIQLRAICSLS